MTRTALLATTLFVALTGVSRAQPVTGLYIGGSGGANFLQREKQDQKLFPLGNPVPTNNTQGYRVGIVGLGSVGYGFGNGLRLEVEGNYRNNQIGSSYRVGSDSGREEKYGAMGNVLFDLDIGSPYLFPYIGGGVGYQRVNHTERVSNPAGVRLSTGSAFAVDSLSPLRTEDNAFAYQAIAGLSIPIPPVVGLSLTAEYRYFALTGTRLATGGGRTKEDYNHGLTLGLRYAFNTPVPGAAEAAPVPVVAPQENRTYLVFFDWDRADLTTRARAIVNEAAQATTKVAVTRIEVAGHTDTSGTPQYNQGLSNRRAQVVAAELVRLGVPRAAITTQAFGESRPLVQTAEGVREPQNRRVEIVLR